MKKSILFSVLALAAFIGCAVATNAQGVVQIRMVTTVPAKCSPSQSGGQSALVWKRSTPNRGLHECTATDTWTYRGFSTAGTMTARGMVYINADSALAVTAAATNGQLLCGSTGVIPALCTITATANETSVTNGAGSITIGLASGINAAKIGGGGVSTTEFDRIGTVTSNVQDQIDAKLTSGATPLSATLYAVDSVGTDAYAITLAPAVASLTDGLIVTFKAGAANTGGATLAVNGLTAKALVKSVGGLSTALETDDIRAGDIVHAQYSSVADNFQVKSLLGNAPAAGISGLTTGEYVVAASATTVATDGVKRYVALISQANTDAPVATVKENSLGGTVVWTRTGGGRFLGTLADAFTSGNTVVFVKTFGEFGASDGTGTRMYYADRVNNNAVQLWQNMLDIDAGVATTVPADDITDLSIEIRVYPAP